MPLSQLAARPAWCCLPSDASTRMRTRSLAAQLAARLLPGLAVGTHALPAAVQAARAHTRCLKPAALLAVLLARTPRSTFNAGGNRTRNKRNSRWLAVGVRLITPCRPMYGYQTHRTSRTLHDSLCAEDLGREDSLLCLWRRGNDGELRTPSDELAHIPDGSRCARGNEAESMDDDDADSRANRWRTEKTTTTTSF
jgi:hypothetical protein